MAVAEDQPNPRVDPVRRIVFAPPQPVRARRSIRAPLPRLKRSPAQASALTSQAGTDTSSPTAPIGHVLLTLAIGLVVALVLGAQGLVHAGKGMDYGLERTITLGIGEPLVAVTQALHVTSLWNGAEAALGRSPDSQSSPLLSQESKSPRSSPRSQKSTVTTSPPEFRTPTSKNPLRFLVTGDSLTEFMGPQIVDRLTRLGKVRAITDTHYGTGLVRPDFVDWSVVARQQVAAQHPEAVVVFMGGNDNQNIQLPSGQILQAASPQWTREYQRRAAVCMRIWTQGGRSHVFWLSVPPARSDSWTRTNHQMDVALRAAAAGVPGARYVDILAPVTNHGRYADFVNVNGQPTLVRAQDGIHFSVAGSSVVADEVVSLIKRQWHLGQTVKTSAHTRGQQKSRPAT